MPLNLASPGISIREVDITSGRVDPTSNSIAAIVSPFEMGPVGYPIIVTNEQQLLSNYGKPRESANNYETWFVSSSYLAYGGNLNVIRSDGPNLTNAKVGSGTSIKIKSYQDYIDKGYDSNYIQQEVFVARNPGSWGNSIKVAIIDAKADQILSGINTLAGVGGALQVGYGVTQSVQGRINPGAGVTAVLGGHIKGIVTGILNNAIEVKIISHVSSTNIEQYIDYQPEGVWKFSSSGSVGITTNNYPVSYGSTSYLSSTDWYDSQVISLENSSIYWNSIANRPSTSSFADLRGSRFDEIHIVVIDGDGSISGNEATILEKHLSVSKASNAIYSSGSPAHWNKVILENSSFIFAGSQPVGVVTTGVGNNFALKTNGSWNTNTINDLNYNCIGSQLNTLVGGKNYDGGISILDNSSLSSSLTDLSAGYDLLSNTEEYDIDFILMGSASYDKETCQALASKIIAVAEERKNSIAFISPYRSGVIGSSGNSSFSPINSTTVTDNVIGFYSPIPSSSYAIFDSGYKYMYDRFFGTFRYIPLNGDIAGMCARTDSAGTPWVSPAGTSRGSVLNAVKLAYNPSKLQRDRLYANRINPVIVSPGSGIILFGDKTGLSKSSSFDRINVRRLFMFIEKAISRVAKDQLFEFNDSITRSTFVNSVEPFLRDLQAKRAIFDFRVICDESNNTASIIDSNEFIADIYIKSSRSINFIGLSFISTKTSVSFEEIIGNV